MVKPVVNGPSLYAEADLTAVLSNEVTIAVGLPGRNRVVRSHDGESGSRCGVVDGCRGLDRDLKGRVARPDEQGLALDGHLVPGADRPHRPRDWGGRWRR